MEQYLIDEIIYSYIIVYIAYINDELISSLNYRKKSPPQKKLYMRLSRSLCSWPALVSSTWIIYITGPSERLHPDKGTN